MMMRQACSGFRFNREIAKKTTWRAMKQMDHICFSTRLSPYSSQW